MTPRLTPGQARNLAAVRERPRIYNDRARGQLEALEAAGLVSVEWDYEPGMKGGGMYLRAHHTATFIDTPANRSAALAAKLG